VSGEPRRNQARSTPRSRRKRDAGMEPRLGLRALAIYLIAAAVVALLAFYIRPGNWLAVIGCAILPPIPIIRNFRRLKLARGQAVSAAALVGGFYGLVRNVVAQVQYSALERRSRIRRPWIDRTSER